MDLERLLRLGGELDVYTDEIVKLTAQPNDTIDIIRADALALKENFDLLLSDRNDHIIEGYAMFKELFAHDKCYLIVEGLDNIVNAIGYQSTMLVLIDDEGNDAHYLVQFNANEQDWYIDAYGLFTSLDTIKARYKNTNIVECKPCDPNDESFTFYEQYKDRCTGLYDSIEASAKEHHDIDSIGDIMDFHDLFLYQSGYDVISRLPFKVA